MYVKVSRRKISEGREGERKQRKGGEGKDMRERKMEGEEESQFSSQTSSSRKKKMLGVHGILRNWIDAKIKSKKELKLLIKENT